MADPTALRARRSRAHRSGDHGLCKPERCPEARPGAEVCPQLQTPPGEIESVLSRYLAGLDLAGDDPRALIAALAQKLARSLDRHTTASLARELRGCVTELIDREPDDEGRAAAAHLLRDLRELTR